MADLAVQPGLRRDPAAGRDAVHAATSGQADDVFLVDPSVKARKREIEALWNSADFYATTTKPEQEALAAEEAALGPRIEALMAEWEALERELTELTAAGS